MSRTLPIIAHSYQNHVYTKFCNHVTNCYKLNKSFQFFAKKSFLPSFHKNFKTPTPLRCSIISSLPRNKKNRPLKTIHLCHPTEVTNIDMLQTILYYPPTPDNSQPNDSKPMHYTVSQNIPATKIPPRATLSPLKVPREYSFSA